MEKKPDGTRLNLYFYGDYLYKERKLRFLKWGDWRCFFHELFHPSCQGASEARPCEGDHEEYFLLFRLLDSSSGLPRNWLSW